MGGFVPDNFVVPGGLAGDGFRLEPLGPQHNEGDYPAWMSSIEHIRSTPGFAGRSWPREMTLAENLGDLERHAEDFAARSGFTYTVLADDGDEIVGCVYIYPLADGQDGADVRSWVRADLDVPLHDAVSAWLREAWPFATIAYAPR
jgi:hypothetical protein